MHVERFGNDEVQGIEFGDCFIFPKLDGTNASTWIEDGEVKAGSRNRELSINDDNAGFCKDISNCPKIKSFHDKHRGLVLYGEWLVPHSFKKYQESAWRKFYIFDVYSKVSEEYLSYNEYVPLLEEFSIDYIPAIAEIKNASYESLLKIVDKNTFLVIDGQGTGEGIVIKNYEYKNRFGRNTFAKIVTNHFKEKHIKEFGTPKILATKMVEDEIVCKYVTKHLVNKVKAKIELIEGGWSSRYIPRLLQTVYYDLINEELWNVVKEMKNPTINFKTLSLLTINRIKELSPEIF